MVKNKSRYNILVAKLILSLSSLLFFCGAIKADEPDEVYIYKTINDISLKLHVFYPENWSVDDQRVGMIFIHGGGWLEGSPSQFFGQSAYLASRGMVAICIEYRLGRMHGTTPRESIEDGKSALRWIRANASKLGVNPQKFVVGGSSAGAHVAASSIMINQINADLDDLAIPIDPVALILINPVVNTGPDGYGYKRVKDYWKEISPSEHVQSGLPPALVLFGDQDPICNNIAMEDFLEKMKNAGNNVELKIYKDYGHGFFMISRCTKAYKMTLIDVDLFLVGLGLLDGEPDEAFLFKQIHEAEK